MDQGKFEMNNKERFSIARRLVAESLGTRALNAKISAEQIPGETFRHLASGGVGDTEKQVASHHWHFPFMSSLSC